jgi:hypothetical protein
MPSAPLPPEIDQLPDLHHWDEFSVPAGPNGSDIKFRRILHHNSSNQVSLHLWVNNHNDLHRLHDYYSRLPSGSATSHDGEHADIIDTMLDGQLQAQAPFRNGLISTVLNNYYSDVRGQYQSAHGSKVATKLFSSDPFYEGSEFASPTGSRNHRHIAPSSQRFSFFLPRYNTPSFSGAHRFIDGVGPWWTKKTTQDGRTLYHYQGDSEEKVVKEISGPTLQAHRQRAGGLNSHYQYARQMGFNEDLDRYWEYDGYLFHSPEEATNTAESELNYPIQHPHLAHLAHRSLGYGGISYQYVGPPRRTPSPSSGSAPNLLNSLAKKIPPANIPIWPPPFMPNAYKAVGTLNGQVVGFTTTRVRGQKVAVYRLLPPHAIEHHLYRNQMRTLSTDESRRHATYYRRIGLLNDPATGIVGGSEHIVVMPSRYDPSLHDLHPEFHYESTNPLRFAARLLDEMAYIFKGAGPGSIESWEPETLNGGYAVRRVTTYALGPDQDGRELYHHVIEQPKADDEPIAVHHALSFEEDPYLATTHPDGQIIWMHGYLQTPSAYARHHSELGDFEYSRAIRTLPDSMHNTPVMFGYRMANAKSLRGGGYAGKFYRSVVKHHGIYAGDTRVSEANWKKLWGGGVATDEYGNETPNPQAALQKDPDIETVLAPSFYDKSIGGWNVPILPTLPTTRGLGVRDRVDGMKLSYSMRKGPPPTPLRDQYFPISQPLVMAGIKPMNSPVNTIWPEGEGPKYPKFVSFTTGSVDDHDYGTMYTDEDGVRVIQWSNGHTHAAPDSYLSHFPLNYHDSLQDAQEHVEHVARARQIH